MTSVSIEPITREGAPNFRDLGGIPVAGGHVAAGCIYRSEGLQALTDAGVQALGQLGVELVCDLRTPSERELHPSRWPHGARPEVLDVAGGLDLRVLRRERVRALYGDASGARARAFMHEIYAAMPATYGPALAVLGERIAEEGRLPVVVHCAAGKDRTGFICSMLLRALGARAEDVEADYLRSDEFFGWDRLREEIARRAGAEPPGAVVDAFRSNTEYLRAAFAEAARQQGSLDGYLASVGLDDERRQRLRAALVTPG